MPDLSGHYTFRSELIDRLRLDLIGPSAPDEVLNDPPITRYQVGILYPGEVATLGPDQDDGDRVECKTVDDEGSADSPEISISSVRYPSAIGITFSVGPEASTLIVTTAAARYEELPGEVDETGPPVSGTAEGQGQAGQDGGPGPAMPSPAPQGKRAHRRHTSRWKRYSAGLQPVTIDVGRVDTDMYDSLAEGLQVFSRIRPADDRGRRSITVMLINTLRSAGGGMRDALSWFQPELRVTSGSDRTDVFVDRPTLVPDIEDEDLRSYQLLYRSVRSLATGHGCAAGWTLREGYPDRAIEIHAELLPTHELELSDSNPLIYMGDLTYRKLSEGDQGSVVESLEVFCQGYAQWIDSQAVQVTELDADLQPIADDHLERCRGALERMIAGVRILADQRDSVPWEAFRLANHAMLQQRIRTDWFEAGCPEGGPGEGTELSWRPFQLAFILLCLEGLTDGSSDDRDLTDLLWFPTGGGKTEAYLGLVAYLIVLRRLRSGDAGAGVTTIMRYTLRLLTIQQFERAALLICALESMRRSDRRLGSLPIEIGLWVGRRATPNTLDAARTAISSLRNNPDLDEGNPLQLQRCPWCGKDLGHSNVFIGKDPRRLIIACKGATCTFRDELPVLVVDEDIYNRHPALLIATADKFAALPYREECRALFNLDSARTMPPELIIQDELHLISGPLGTMTGLYETAVDLLCTRNGVRPKVVASTATIRRAKQQGLSLFDRQVHQFPPPGLTDIESYFATRASREEKASRLYAGVMAPGVSQTTLLVRTYSCLLQSAADIEADDVVRDAYWTLVGYFNSLRVLGGARMQVQDDVNDRMALLAASAGTEPRDIESRIELTSRETSAEIPRHLRRMAVSYPAPDALAVILATNMISVGVDINRLGLMAVMGQPQSTAEYIQATSRVGRRWPGLVLTLFNAAKSRDRSHYEGFPDFHAGLYRQVEATSVTPFSARARDRGLHAVLIGLVRMLVPELRPNDSAGSIEQHRDLVLPVIELIVARARKVEPDQEEATRLHLGQIVESWIRKSETTSQLFYWRFKDPDVSLLVDASIPTEELRLGLPTPWSLRDVDQTSNFYQVT